jgi:hypothetical protein
MRSVRKLIRGLYGQLESQLEGLCGQLGGMAVN